jgi:hypothetical protein
VYWDTGIPVAQPFKEDIDLDADDQGVMAQVRAHVERKGRPWDPDRV